MRVGWREHVANRGATTFSIMLANIMQGIDTTIANLALPHIQGSLSASQHQISWVLNSYIVAAAIMTPLTGSLAGFGISRCSYSPSLASRQLQRCAGTLRSSPNPSSMAGFRGFAVRPDFALMIIVTIG
jgi:MFS family permease